MILTDREILAALQCGHVEINPRPPADALSSTSIDLTLSNVFSVWKKKDGMFISPGEKGYKYSQFLDLQDQHKVDKFTLEPHGFVLAWTSENIKIPIKSGLAARVEGKSSMARLGVGVHITAPTIHCGFEGPVQLEMFNFGPHKIILQAGMPICQLIFEQTYGTPNKGYDGMFLNQDRQGLKP